MPIKDLEARRKYARDWRRKRFKEDPEFREREKARVKRNRVNAKKRAAILIAAFRKNGCENCPENDPSCLAAHHRDPAEKEFTIALAIHDKFSPKRLKPELEKCVCLCFNCHAKAHAALKAAQTG